MMATTSFAPAATNIPYDMNRVANPSPPRSFYPNNGTLPNTPPTNVSPTSFYQQMHVRQLKQPKQPLYTPACLRPTGSSSSRAKDIPDRPRAPETPPQSKENSFDSGKSRKSLSSIASLPTVLSPPEDDFDLLRRGLSRAGSEVVDEELGAVTGPPTMAHWKPNESATACAICQTTFTWYFRKHHCRRCGDVVCGTHFLHTVPLDQNARYHPDGVESKACDICSREWRTIKKLRHSRTSSLADSMSSSQGTAMPPMAIPQHLRVDSSMHVGSMAHSEGTPWSTF